MLTDKYSFAQLMDFIHLEQFQRGVRRHGGSYKLKSFSCWDQFLCMACGQLTYRDSLAKSWFSPPLSRATEGDTVGIPFALTDTDHRGRWPRSRLRHTAALHPHGQTNTAAHRICSPTK